MDRNAGNRWLYVGGNNLSHREEVNFNLVVYIFLAGREAYLFQIASAKVPLKCSPGTNTVCRYNMDLSRANLSHPWSQVPPKCHPSFVCGRHSELRADSPLKALQALDLNRCLNGWS